MATSVPVAVEPTGHIGRQFGFVEFDNRVEDLILPEEVTQELERDAGQLPDPHRVPEPTSLGIPEGVAGFAARTAATSVWAEPPTPSRSDYVDGTVNDLEGDESKDGSEEPELPQEAKLLAALQPTTPRNLARVQWEDGYTSPSQSNTTPRDQLDNPEQAFMQPTSFQVSPETPQEELSSISQSLALPTPVQTPVEKHQRERGIVAQPVAPLGPADASPEAPREESQTLERSLFTGLLTGGVPPSTHGNLTRESTMTDATWSQGPISTPLLRHATSTTLTGESCFPSQLRSSTSRRALSEQGELENTLEGAGIPSIKNPAKFVSQPLIHRS